MEKYKVSIIVTVYKHERYIRKCIESIINQTYKNLEIILVDDGTPPPDCSGKICDEYAKKDKRIKVIHKKNGGCCEARNFGLKKATGDYISIIDGDDWLEPDYVEYLMKIIKKTKADMAIAPNVFTTRDRKQVEKDEITVWTPEEAVANLIYPVMMIGPWSKLYSAKMLKKYNITFSTPWSGEGLYFAVMSAQRANRVGVGTRKVYNYRMNNVDSGLTNYNVQMGINARDCIMNYTARDVIFDTPLVQNAINWHIWKNHHFLLKLIIATDSTEKYNELYQDCLKNIRKSMFRTAIHSRVSPREKVKIVINSFFPIWHAKRMIRLEQAALKEDIENEEI